MLWEMVTMKTYDVNIDLGIMKYRIKNCDNKEDARITALENLKDDLCDNPEILENIKVKKVNK